MAARDSAIESIFFRLRSQQRLQGFSVDRYMQTENEWNASNVGNSESAIAEGKQREKKRFLGEESIGRSFAKTAIHLKVNEI